MPFHHWIKTKPPKHKFGQWIATVVVSNCFFSTGMAMAWTSPAFDKVNKKKVDMTLDHYEMSLIVALAFAGRFTSPLPMSYLMDYIGRRNTLIAGRLLQLAHWLMLYFSYNVVIMYFARVINGWYGGLTLFAIPVYIAETTHKTIRGRAQGLLNVQFLIGIVFESIVGPFLSYDNLILVSLCVDVFLFVFMVAIPETPYFLAMQGKMEEAEVSLQWLRGNGEDVSEELYRIERVTKQQLSVPSRYIEIVRDKAIRKAFITSVMLLGIQRLSGMTAMIPYGSFIFPDTAWLHSDKGPILLNGTYLLLCAISGCYVDKWGRKNFLVLSSAGACVFLVGCTIWFFLHHNSSVDVSGTEWVVVIFIVLQAAFYSTGYFYIPALVSSEIFPMHIKAKANALCFMLGITMSTTVVYIFLPLTNHFGLYANFLIYSISTFIGAIFSTTIIETKGKSLEVIQAVLEGRSDVSDSTVGIQTHSLPP